MDNRFYCSLIHYQKLEILKDIKEHFKSVNFVNGERIYSKYII